MDFRVKRLLSFGVGDERVTTVDYSVYVYTNDASNRRATIVKSGSAYTSPVTETYTYDTRDQLISGQGLSYVYDDIGNRITAEGKTYIANNLNQYTKIDDFVPQYDADGNQTLIKTETGIWSVVYNAENRPVRWQSGDTVITMAFDRMGRRIEMRTQSADSDTLQRFVYDNYLCVQQLRGTDNALFQSYVWDPTEPIATRPLIFPPPSGILSYYFHDGNKNVSDLVSLSGVAVHYDYTPFGTPTSSVPSENPYVVSSEVFDSQLDLAYYNYRHYNSCDTRWIGRDHIQGFNGYLFCENAPLTSFDWLGLLSLKEAVVQEMDDRGIVPSWLESIRKYCSQPDYEDLTFEYYRVKYGDQAVFDAWLNQEAKSTEWQNSLPECPKCINVDTLEAPSSEWERPHARDRMYNPDKYHPEAAYEMRTAHPNEFGAGNQCIYDENGCLISSGVSAGTTDRKQAPLSRWEGIKDFFSRSGHIANDVRPYDWAYRLDGNTHGKNVMEYLRLRPPK